VAPSSTGFPGLEPWLASVSPFFGCNWGGGGGEAATESTSWCGGLLIPGNSKTLTSLSTMQAFLSDQLGFPSRKGSQDDLQSKEERHIISRMSYDEQNEVLLARHRQALFQG
jgi:hypothetical protein